MAEEDTDDKALREAHNVLESRIGDDGIVAIQAYIRQSEDRQTAALQRLEDKQTAGIQRMEDNMQRLEEKIDRNLRWTLMFVVAWTGVIFAALKLVG